MSQSNSVVVGVFLAALDEYVNRKVPLLLVQLQENRFANQGAFNDHERWLPNVRPDIIAEKSNKPVMVDSGELYKELTTPENWKIDVKFSNQQLSINIPKIETFTNPKYDSLENNAGGKYFGSATGKQIVYKWKPPRMFKELSDIDEKWIETELEKALVNEFPNEFK